MFGHGEIYNFCPGFSRAHRTHRKRDALQGAGPSSGATSFQGPLLLPKKKDVSWGFLGIYRIARVTSLDASRRPYPPLLIRDLTNRPLNAAIKICTRGRVEIQNDDYWHFVSELRQYIVLSVRNLTNVSVLSYILKMQNGGLLYFDHWCMNSYLYYVSGCNLQIEITAKCMVVHSVICEIKFLWPSTSKVAHPCSSKAPQFNWKDKMVKHVTDCRQKNIFLLLHQEMPLGG